MGDIVGDSEPALRSTSPAPSPTLCQHWEYRDHGEYHPGDIKIEAGPSRGEGEPGEQADQGDEDQ